MRIKFDRNSIKKIREQLEMNQTDFARRLETSRQRVDNVESMVSKPQVDFLTDISNEFDIPITAFFCPENSKLSK